MAAGSLTGPVDEENLADFLSNSYTPRDLKVKERIKPSKQLERSLVTISESSEILYSLIFSKISGMDSELVIPPEAKYDKRLSIYLNDSSSSSEEEEEEDGEDWDEDMDNYTINNNNSTQTSPSDEMNEVSEELNALKDRAKRLSEELKMLTQSSFEDSDTKIEPISQEKIHSILNEEPPPPETNSDTNLFELTKKRLQPIRTPAPILQVEENPSLIRINAESYKVDSDESEEEEEEEEEEIQVRSEDLVPRLNFDRRGPKPREEKPSFPDLSLHGEKKLKTCKGGSRDWLMPFREKLYFESTYEGPEKEIDFTDPIFYAPTGDIYSYFQRRQLYPHPFKMPTQYQTKKALSNRQENPK